MLQVSSPSWKAYAKQVVLNARALAEVLVGQGYKLQTQGTDNHLVLWDLRPVGLTGSKVEKICDFVGITINSMFLLINDRPFSLTDLVENAVSGDASAQVPGGIRLGTSALTSRSMKEDDIRIVADFLHRAVQLSLELQKEAGSKLLKDFERVATTGDGEGRKKVLALCKEVRAFAKKWPLPGVDVSSLKKPEGFEGDDA